MGNKRMHIMAKIMKMVDIDWLPTENMVDGECEVDLSGDTMLEEVNMLLKALVYYNGFHLDANAEKRDLIVQMILGMEQELLEFPGGIRFVGDGKFIYPGVGCDLRSWKRVAEALKEYKSPWMGTDPMVTSRLEDGICYVADTDLLEREREEMVDGLCYRVTRQLKIQTAMLDKRLTIIGYSKEEFQEALGGLEEDFTDFVKGPLKIRMEELDSELAGAFCKVFMRNYG